MALLGQLYQVLMHHNDHRLQTTLISESFASYLYDPISHPETLIAQALEHFEHFDDPDLECGSQPTPVE
jgi:hypothetical protein